MRKTRTKKPMPTTRFSAMLLLLLLALPRLVLAQDLYAGTVPVASQSEADRRAAAPAALRQVLVKQSGQRDPRLDASGEAALARANELLVSFQYQQNPLPGQAEPQLELIAGFLPSAVDQLVRDLRLPRWRLERMPVTLWLVLDDGLGRKLMPVEYREDYARLEQEALRRGLPVRWPELDEAALAAIDVQLLWGGYTEQLWGAEAPAVAIGTARREGPDWRLRWTYEDGSSATGWRMQDRDLQRGLTEGINRLADEVAAANTITAAGAGVQRAVLTVTGLNNGEDFARVLAYLEALSLIDAVRVRDAQPATVIFELSLNAAPRFLEDALQRDGLLIAGEGRMAFRLRPKADPVQKSETSP